MTLTRRAIEVNWQNLALGHDISKMDGATFVRNTTLPDIYDANFMFDITASEPAEIERLLARAAGEYAKTPKLTFRVDPFTPAAFEARLALEGYECCEAIVLVLEGSLRARATSVQILPIEDEAGWTAYTELKRISWREHAAHRYMNPDDTVVADRLASSSRLKCPPVEYVLAHVDGCAVGHCSRWLGLETIGQVEDLFVHPAHRHRGIATALIHQCVETSRAQGAGPMVIVVEATNSAKQMYVAMGWRPVAICRQYSMETPAACRR